MSCQAFVLRLLLVALALSGCAGARGSIAFNKLEYPVSMSRYVETPSGRALSPNDVEVVGEVKHETRLWGMGYSLIRLSGEKDVSGPINEQVRAARGEGVSELSVVADYCALNHVPVLNFLPIWPACVDISIQGKIFRNKPAPPPANPAPPAPAPTPGIGASSAATQNARDSLAAAAAPDQPAH